MADGNRERMRKAVDEQREAVYAWLETTGTTVALVALGAFVILFFYIGFFR